MTMRHSPVRVLVDPSLRRRALAALWRRFGFDGRVSYSQAGEDLILALIFESLGVDHPLYLDIGANHPRRFSNTYLFYRWGGRGVLVEPDPGLLPRLRRARPHDLTLGVGIAPQPGELEFFRMSEPALNTFSREEAESLVSQGHRIVAKVVVPVITIGEALAHCPRTPDLISLDIEGMDEAVLASLDFSRHRPLALCVETITYSATGDGRKLSGILELMRGHGYMNFADTHINTIFVDEQCWRHR
jgi:FkbM family methyltransferase